MLAVAGTLSTQAQEKVISSADFAAAERTADATFQAKQIPARWTVDTQSRMEGRPQTDYVSRTVMEFGPNGSRRQSSQSTFGGGPIKRETVIKIGDKTYNKIDREEWKEGTVETVCGAEETASETAVSEPHVEYKYLGSGVLNGKKVLMFLKTESRKTTEKTTGAVTETEASTRYWFGESSDLYRSEHRSTTRTGGKIFHTNITIEKELDPSISISAPERTISISIPVMSYSVADKFFSING